MLAAFICAGLLLGGGVPVVLRRAVVPARPRIRRAHGSRGRTRSRGARRDHRRRRVGHGLPEVVRAAARALDASLVLIDRSSAVLAVAARSPADERALMADANGVGTHELRVGDTTVGRLRLRGRSRRAGGRAAADRHHADRLRGRARARARARVRGGAGGVPARGAAPHGHRPRRHRRARGRGRRRRRGRRGRRRRPRAPLRARGGRLARARARRRRARRARRGARLDRGASTTRAETTAGQVLVLAPAADEDESRRTAEAVARELQADLHGFTFAVGYSRVAHRPRRPVPRRQRGAARRQRRRGQPGGDEATPTPPRCSPSRRPAPTGSCCPR